MTKIKKSKLTEILKSYGVSEGFLSKFLKYKKVQKRERIREIDKRPRVRKGS